MVAFFIQLLLAIRSWFTRRARLEVENLLLRQQLIVLRRRHPKRVLLWNIDRLLMVWLYRLYPSLLDAIIIVQPETVIRWHRRGFRAYWRWKSRHVGGRPRIDSEIRALIRQMSGENPLWGGASSEGWRVQWETVPPRQRASSLVACMAGRRETNDLKPIDRVVGRTTASHRAAA
jgi:hypothetical protein